MPGASREPRPRRRCNGSVKRLALLLALAATTIAGSAAAQPAARAHVAKSSKVLAVVGTDVNAPSLRWLDPSTLRRLGPRGVALAGGQSPVFSPNGSKIAAGSEGSGIEIADVRRMKVIARVARLTAWGSSPVAWLAPNRLLALQRSDRSGAQMLAVIDPVAKKVVRRVPLNGYPAWQAAGREVVFVGHDGDGIGAASLLVVDRNGGVRRVALDRIQAGWRMEGTEPEAVYRQASPGLAVDGAGHAYVVGQPTVVADIDLATLAVTYHELRLPSSLLGRFLSWLQPTASAKAAAGWSRQAVWLGSGRLAITGSDYEGLRTTPAGLTLADLVSGELQPLEPDAGYAVLAGDLLLGVGASWDSATEVESGMGIAAYSLDGRRLWSALADEPVWWVQATGGYAYIDGRTSYPETVRVVDLESGSVRTLRGRMPSFVVR
jgi:hypothetical protein